MSQENQKSMSCRKVVMRHLPMIVSDGMVNGRKEIRRSRIKSGMTPNLRGFTLIELLVVVLIIGILAAVALTQYQKVVEKSRATQALTLLKSIDQAVRAYALANGEGPTGFDELAVDIPSGWIGTEQAVQFEDLIKDTRSNGDWSLQLFQSAGSGTQIFMMRLSGPYKGAGFAVKSWPFTEEEVSRIHCREIRASGVVFEKNSVAVCNRNTVLLF